MALLPGTAVADTLAAGALSEIELVGADAIRRRIVAVEQLGPSPRSPLATTISNLLDGLPELIPRARRIV